MPKMLPRKDIEFQLKRAERELKDLLVEKEVKMKNPQQPSDADVWVWFAREWRLKGLIEAYTGVLG